MVRLRQCLENTHGVSADLVTIVAHSGGADDRDRIPCHLPRQRGDTFGKHAGMRNEDERDVIRRAAHAAATSASALSR